MAREGLLLGYDVGSSSIKAALVDAATGQCVASATSPEREMEIVALKPGWAEQDPAMWWEHVVRATRLLAERSGRSLADVRAIGISYQMHGLVMTDSRGEPLRRAIIWCDSRAVGIGERAFDALGRDACLSRLLNSPGNFTASKLKWVMENEPQLFARCKRIMLPGDFLAWRMTGQAVTTASGLSEGIMWDFRDDRIADMLLDHYGITRDLVPPVVPTFSEQGRLTPQAAAELGLPAGTPLTYRAGDQPNNALSLRVLEPGELAATAGTSGVICGIGDSLAWDPPSRVNTFLHVNHTAASPRYATLLCVNGTGILNSWLRRNVMGDAAGYDEMNALAATAPIGSDGLSVLPFGNGAERPLGNRNLSASVHGLEFNRHSRAHLLRAGQEGIAFALNYGREILAEMGIRAETVRAGHANMFLSPIFSETFASVTGATVELYHTDGARGAAAGAGVGAGIYRDPHEALAGLTPVRSIAPDAANRAAYEDAYGHWRTILEHRLRR